MVASERHIGDKVTRETRYFISSLPNDAKAFAKVVRGHWAIENGLHWVLDTAFREDESRVRDRNAATDLAAVRRFAVSLCKNDYLLGLLQLS